MERDNKRKELKEEELEKVSGGSKSYKINNSTSLESIELPNSLESIGKNAFKELNDGEL